MHRTLPAQQDAPVIEQDALPGPPSVDVEVGTAPCDGMRCAAGTGIACAYIDRRGRSCPTAWCPSHRTVVNGTVYCALHAASVSGAQPTFADTLHPDLGSRLPALIAWISRVAEDDIVATLHGICRDRDEVLVGDPVRRLLLGTLREPTWERAWKTCSADGVGARVAIAVEEAQPDEVLAKVNSQVIARLSTPRDNLGEEPPPDVVELLVRQLVLLIGMALDRWQQEELSESEPAPPAQLLMGERAPAALAGRAEPRPRARRRERSKVDT